MPQNDKNHIKNHIDKFPEFYKKNKALREVQIAKMKGYIARKSKRKEREPKAHGLGAQTRATDGSGSVLTPQRR